MKNGTDGRNEEIRRWVKGRASGKRRQAEEGKGGKGRREKSGKNLRVEVKNGMDILRGGVRGKQLVMGGRQGRGKGRRESSGVTGKTRGKDTLRI